MAPKLYTDFMKWGVQIRILDGADTPILEPAQFRSLGQRNLSNLVETTVRGLLAHIDQANRVEKLGSAKKGYTEQGKFLYGRPPFGYRLELKTINAITGKVERVPVIDSQTYPLLLEIPRLVLVEHLSDVAIAERFNRLGYKTPTGKPWISTTITRLRNNWFYAGFVTYGEVKRTRHHTIKNPDPSTIVRGRHSYGHPWTVEEFEAMAQVKSARARQGGRAAASVSPLAGVLKCGYCSGGMVLKTAGVSAANRHRHLYACIKYSLTLTECCPNRWATGTVWAEVKKELDRLAAASREVSPSEDVELVDNRTVVAGLENRLRHQRKELDAMDGRRRQINKAFQLEVLELEDYRQQLSELEAEKRELGIVIAELEAELAQAGDQVSRSERIRTIMHAWETIEPELGQAGHPGRWSAHLVNRVKFEIIQALFEAIYVREPDGGSPRDNSSRKLQIHVEFKYS
jgi:hypothetical protein